MRQRDRGTESETETERWRDIEALLEKTLLKNIEIGHGEFVQRNGRTERR